jgi:hypothetical protein
VATWQPGLVKQRRAAKAIQNRFQNPEPAVAAKLLKRLQGVVDRVCFDSFHFVRTSTAHQAYDAGGLQHLDVAAHLQAESALLVRRMLLEPCGSHPWRNFWRFALKQTYPGLGPARGLGLLTSSCSFQLLRDSPHASLLQRQAFAAWADLGVHIAPPRPPTPAPHGPQRCRTQQATPASLGCPDPIRGRILSPPRLRPTRWVRLRRCHGG